MQCNGPMCFCFYNLCFFHSWILNKSFFIHYLKRFDPSAGRRWKTHIVPGTEEQCMLTITQHITDIVCKVLHNKIQMNLKKICYLLGKHPTEVWLLLTTACIKICSVFVFALVIFSHFSVANFTFFFFYMDRTQSLHWYMYSFFLVYLLSV